MRPGLSCALLALCLLCACAGKRGTPDNEPTLKTLAGRQVVVEKDSGVVASEAQAIEAYKQFLAIAPKAPQRAEAMRRIGDLEMDSADNRSASDPAANAPDYRAAIARYQDFLKTYPADPGNDRVLYQLARAYEQGGDLETALKTLDRLVKDYPATRYRDEAQFRRGELLFTARDYATAEKAYATVLAGGPGNPYHDRALYMQGWSLFKQGRLEEALHSFFGVLDLKVADREGEGGLETLDGLTRADRELVEDTFRVTSISLANLQGAESIPAYIDSPARRSYEFRVYEQLGELYIKQDRIKDAADTFGLFARRNPLHAQAPQLQARVIEIYERSGFATLALEAKKEYVASYGVASEFRRANPQGWERAQPLVKTHLTELARHYHASAQKTKSQRRLPGGGALVPRLPRIVPDRPGGRAEQLPARRAAVRGPPLRRGRRRVREDRLRLSEAREERRCRLRRAARLRAAAEESCAGRGARAAAGERRQRVALRRCVPERAARRAGARRRRREALCAARRRAGRSRRPARARPAAGGRRCAAPRRLDRARPHRVRARRVRPVGEELRRGAEADAGERRGAQRPGRAPGRVDLQAGRAGARGRPGARRGRALRARRHGRAAVDRARDRAVRRRRVADRA